MSPAKNPTQLDESQEALWIDREALYERLLEWAEDEIEPDEKVRNIYQSAAQYVKTVYEKSRETSQKKAEWRDDESQLMMIQVANQRTAEAYTALADIFFSDQQNKVQTTVSHALETHPDVISNIVKGFRGTPLHRGDHALQSLFVAQESSFGNIAHMVRNLEYDGHGTDPKNREEIIVRAICYALSRAEKEELNSARFLSEALGKMAETNLITKCKEVEIILTEASRAQYTQVFEKALKIYVRGYLYYKTMNGGQFLDRYTANAKYFASHALAEVFNGKPRPGGDLDALITPDYLATMGLDAKAAMLLHQSRASAEKICELVRRHLLGILE